LSGGIAIARRHARLFAAKNRTVKIIMEGLCGNDSQRQTSGWIEVLEM
jgi:hypothetical protein